MGKTAERIPVLDGLRALAIILVMLRLSITPFWRDASQPFMTLGGFELGSIFMNGWVGVDLFFVISGFLVTSHLLKIYSDDGFKKGQLPVYFRRRFLRIVPSYYLILAVSCIGIAPFAPLAEGGVSGWGYIYHLLFLQDYLPSDINMVFWTLAVQVKFYLLAPLMVMLLLRLPALTGYIFVTSLFVGVALLRWNVVQGMAPVQDIISYISHVRMPFHLSADGLIAGMIAALLWHDSARDFIEKKLVANMLFFGGVLLLLFIALPAPVLETDLSVFDKTGIVSLVSVAFSAMLLGLLGGSYGQGVFGWRPLSKVALVSYGLYLVSRPMLYPAILAARAIAPDRGNGFSDAEAWLFALPFYVFFAVAMASALYFLIERPVTVWGKRREKTIKHNKKD